MKRRVISAILFSLVFVAGILNQTGYANSKIGIVPSDYDLGDRSYVLCFAIKNDNTLWAWEDYKYEDNEYEPVKIADNVISVSGGYYLTTYGELYRCDNQIIDGTVKSSLVADDVDEFCGGPWTNYIIKKDKSLWAEGSNASCGFGVENRQFKSDNFIKIMNNVQKVAAGGYHTAILKTDGSLWTFGTNSCGQLGIGSYEDSYRKNKIMDNVKYINASVLSVFAIKNDNSLWTCGSFEYGGVDIDNNRLAPTYFTDDAKQVSCRYGDILVLKNNGELWLYGATETATRASAVAKKETDYAIPKKIMNNVAAITDEMIETHETDIALMLTDNGELFRYNVTWSNGKGAIDIKHIMDDVKLPEDKFDNDDINGYSDIKATDGRYDCIISLLNAGIFRGVTDTEFAPDKAINRAETAALLLRMTGKGDETAITHFTDVPTDSWYYTIAGAAQKYGIIDGYEDNTFRGEETVSDLQLAVLAARTLRNEGTAVEPYPEQSITVPSNIPDWAADDISYAIKYGILTDEEAGKLSDTNGMTRGEAAVILYRLYCAV